MVRRLTLRLTNQLILLLLILGSTSCRETSTTDTSVGSRFLRKDTAALSEAAAPIADGEVLIAKVEPEIVGRFLFFKNFSGSLLTDDDVRAILEIRFEKDKVFPIEQLRIALNGVLGSHHPHFDLARISRWEKDNRGWKLLIEVSELEFDSRIRFLRKLFDLSLGRGRLWVWLACASPDVAEASLSFYKKTPAPPQPMPAVVFDETPPKVGTDRSVVFRFHAEHGNPAFECRLNHRPIPHCDSPVRFGHLRRGRHVFRVRSVSQGHGQGFHGQGNKHFAHGPWAEYEFEIVKALPGSVRIVNVVPPESPTGSSSIAIHFQVEGSATKAECRLDGGVYSACVSPVSYEGLGDGKHTAEIQALGSTGQPVGTPASYSWIVDRTPPQLTWLETPPVLTNASTASFDAAVSEEAAFSCELDEGAAQACAFPITISSLAEGVHNLSVTARDAAGNVSLPATFRWTVDLTAPQVTITGANPPQNPSPSSAMVLSFLSNEAGTLSCTLDGTTLEACASPLSIENLADGQHRFEVRARDAAGNEGAAAIREWLVDTVSPQLVLQMTFPTSLPTRFGQAEFDLVTSEAASFTCSLDGARPVACASPLRFSGLPEGSRNLEVTATDAAGHSVSASFSWLIDLTKPVLTLGTPIPSEAVTSSRDIEIPFSVSEAADLRCELDQSEPEPCSSPFVKNGLADGMHRFVLRARDAAGNFAEAVEYQWEIVSVAVVTMDNVTPSEALTSSREIQFEFSSQLTSRFECSLDGSSFASCTSPAAFAALSDGAHSFEVRGLNTAGVPGPIVSHAWTIDASALLLTFRATPSDALVASGQIAFEFSANEPASFFCSQDGAAASACVSPVNLSVADGAHSFSVFASDGLGNQSAPSTHSWTVDSTAPAVLNFARTPAGDVLIVRDVQFDFAVSEAAQVFCSLDGAAPIACGSPVNVSGLADGSHSMEVFARDAAGNESAHVASNWTVDASVPVARIIFRDPPEDLTSRRDATIAFSADEQASFLCSVDGAAPSGCVSPLVLNGLSDGAHVVEITARDAAGNSSASVQTGWTVDGSAPVVTIVSRRPATSPSNDTIFAADYVANEPVRFFCSLDGGAFSACGSTFGATGMADGVHSFAVFGRDLAGNIGNTAATTWVVDTSGPVVSITGSTPSHSPSTSTTKSVAFTVSETAAVTCSLDGAAAVECVSPHSVSGLADGSHTLDIVATDALGNAGAPVSLTWEVDTTALEISSFNILNITQSSATIIWITNVPANSEVRYGVGSTINQTSGVFPEFVEEHTVQLTGLNRFTAYTIEAVSIDRDGREVRRTRTFRTSN